MEPAAAHGGDGERPLFLRARDVTGGIQIELIAGPGLCRRSTYALEVVGNGNRSVNRGSVEPGHAGHTVLSRVSIGLAEQAEWLARLTVEADGGPSYEQVLGSSS